MDIPIKGYEGLYLVSDEGYVMNLRKMRHLTVSNNGKVSLRKAGNNTDYDIDELVYSYFVCPEFNSKYRKIRHIDGDPNNHSANNLITESSISSLDGEIWKPFGLMHEVSNFGRVRNLKKDMLLVQSYSENAVCTVSIADNYYRVAELVAQVFIDPSITCVDFLDGDIHNNHVSNLTASVHPPCEEGEEWRDVIGYSGRYLISSKGRLYTVPRKETRGDSVVTIKGRLIPPSEDEDGYYRVTLTSSVSNRFDAFMHRLVAQAFIPNPDNLPQVNHKDGNKKHNCVSNLEWVTNIQNVDHAWATGLNDNRTRNNPNAYDVVVKSNEDELHFDSIALAAKYFNVDEESLRLYLHGRSKRCRNLPEGLTFEYVQHKDKHIIN